MSVITLNHPDGSVRLDVPGDVAIGELMAEFLEVTGQPDRPDWALTAPGGEICPADRTLADLRVADGSTLVLRPAAAANDTTAVLSAGLTKELPAIEGAPRLDAPRRAGDRQAQRPVSARMADALPVRPLLSDRVAFAARAIVTRRPIRSAVAGQCGLTAVPDPATFTLPARVSPFGRVRHAWALTRYDRLLERQITAVRLRRCATIAVVSPKGGVGKSTTTALLGSLLAFLRRDRVVAIDTNPDWGSLGRRLVPDHQVFIDDLLAGPLKDSQLSATQLDAQLGRGPDGLMIAPAPTDPARAHALDQEAYRLLFAKLGELVGTLVLDCGTGLDSPAARAALAAARSRGVPGRARAAAGCPGAAGRAVVRAGRLRDRAPAGDSAGQVG
jgi:hypothetical protein